MPQSRFGFLQHGQYKPGTHRPQTADSVGMSPVRLKVTNLEGIIFPPSILVLQYQCHFILFYFEFEAFQKYFLFKMQEVHLLYTMCLFILVLKFCREYFGLIIFLYGVHYFNALQKLFMLFFEKYISVCVCVSICVLRDGKNISC